MPLSRWRRAVVAFGAAVGLLGGCTSGAGAAASGQPPASSRPAAPTVTASGATPSAAQASGPAPSSSRTRAGSLPRPDHVLVVLFENKDEQQVMGSGDAPYLNSLAASGARFTNSHGIAHPSQPNYLALFSGSNQGVTDDACPQDLGDRPNLGEQLVKAGYTFAGYSEGMPSAGFTGCTDPTKSYARRHNPWVDFSNIPASSNLPYTDFPKDLSQLPTVAFVVPNLCHDMHDCDVATGDAWARDHLAPYVAWAQTHNSLLVVTFDEDDDTQTNRIPTFLVGPMVRPVTLTQPITHYNLLRMIEDLYGLEPLGQAAHASPLTGWAR